MNFNRRVIVVEQTSLYWFVFFFRVRQYWLVVSDTDLRLKLEDGLKFDEVYFSTFHLLIWVDNGNILYVKSVTHFTVSDFLPLTLIWTIFLLVFFWGNSIFLPIANANSIFLPPYEILSSVITCTICVLFWYSSPMSSLLEFFLLSV